MPRLFLCCLAMLMLLACGATPAPPSAHDAALIDVKQYVNAELTALQRAVTDLQRAAPRQRAWSRVTDAVAVHTMQMHWREARTAYEHIEGAIAVLFSNYDIAIDGRYDQFIEGGAHDCPNAAIGDCFLFNGVGVTGMHAIERILWSDVISEPTRAFESSFPNYQAARFPSDAAEANAFADELVAKLADDIAAMRAEFAPLALDLGAAYRGVLGSLEEQREKVNFADSGHDESRYAQHTLADMRANLAGGWQIYQHFSAWMRSRDSGAALDAAIVQAFADLAAIYDQFPGDRVPEVPAKWSSIAPSDACLRSDYGALWRVVQTASDGNAANSLVSLMRQGAALLEFEDDGK